MTFEELKKRLINENVDKRKYSFSKNNLGDCMVLLHNSIYWEIYYTERGEIFDRKIFVSEKKACLTFYNIVKKMR